MTDSVYKVVTLIRRPKSWERAAKAAVEAASHSLRELRIAEVVERELVITDGKVEAYRTKVRVSFKYEGNRYNTHSRQRRQPRLVTLASRRSLLGVRKRTSTGSLRMSALGQEQTFATALSAAR